AGPYDGIGHRGVGRIACAVRAIVLVPHGGEGRTRIDRTDEARGVVVGLDVETRPVVARAAYVQFGQAVVLGHQVAARGDVLQRLVLVGIQRCIEIPVAAPVQARAAGQVGVAGLVQPERGKITEIIVVRHAPYVE